MWKNQKFILLIHSASSTCAIPHQQQCYQFSQSAFKSVVRNYQFRAPAVTRKDSCNCSTNTNTRNMRRFGYACVFKYYHCDRAGGGGSGATLQKIRTDSIPMQAQQWNLSVRHLVHSTTISLQEENGVRSCRSHCSWLETLNKQSSSYSSTTVRNRTRHTHGLDYFRSRITLTHVACRNHKQIRPRLPRLKV